MKNTIAQIRRIRGGLRITTCVRAGRPGRVK